MILHSLIKIVLMLFFVGVLVWVLIRVRRLQHAGGPVKPSKISAFLVGAVVGIPLSFIALWGLAIESAEAAALTILVFAILVGLVSAFAAEKTTEKVISYFLTLFLGP